MRSLDRALALIELFAECGTELTLTSAARTLDMPMSSCFNLFRAMRDRGYLYEVRTKTFYPTNRLMQQAAAISRSDPVRINLRPNLEVLRDQCGESILLTKRVLDRSIIIDVVAGTHIIRYNASAGDFRPLYNSASGKALLGALAEAERERLISNIEMRAVTARTLTSRPALSAEVREGIARGWFMTRGEGVIDVMSLARPIEVNGSVYAVAVAGPIHRMEPIITKLAVKLVSCCERMTRNAKEARRAN
jgi:IclR family acetate operon transcriptional repressor